MGAIVFKLTLRLTILLRRRRKVRGFDVVFPKDMSSGRIDRVIANLSDAIHWISASDADVTHALHDAIQYLLLSDELSSIQMADNRLVVFPRLWVESAKVDHLVASLLAIAATHATLKLAAREQVGRENEGRIVARISQLLHQIELPVDPPPIVGVRDRVRRAQALVDLGVSPTIAEWLRG
ncbi:MAG: hypothetical protein Q8K82_07040 [Gemmatimonadaceae bacterium]|nr:hypothetical protein [Gemmatimonadaceae bacterium]